MRNTPRLPAVLSAVLVLAVIAGVLSWASLSRVAAPRAAAATSRSVAIRATTLVCPSVGGAGKGGASRIAYADASSTPGVTDSAVARPLDAVSATTPLPVHPGHAWVVDGPATATPMRIAVAGELTDSLAAMQFTRQVVGAGALQLSTAACEAPVTDAWFAGMSTQVGAHVALLLSNVDDVPASVDIGLYDETNPPSPQARRGVRVDPQSQVVIALDALDPGVSNLVVHVSVTSGRVAPAVRYDVENGQIPLGTAWVPRTDGPADKQTVPGLVAGDGARQLVLANPGDLDANVSLSVSTPDGSFAPQGSDQVTVPAGQAMSVDLQPALGKEAGAVVVTSDQPVVAGASSSLPASKLGASDVAFSAAVPALSGPTVMPGGEGQTGRVTSLILSAADADVDAHVTVTILPAVAASTPTTATIDVPAGTTTEVQLSSLAKDVAPGVVVNPSGGRVYAAWVIQEAGTAGGDLGEVPLRTPARALVVPPARADVNAAFR